MKVTVKIEPGLTEPEVVIRAPALTPEVQALSRALHRREGERTIPVFSGEQAIRLPLADILRFYADGKGVCCQSTDGVYTVKQRLYELEAMLEGSRFVRVSHSEIVNLDRITALDLSITGTIRISLGSVTAYASRRYVKKIKQAVGL
ncbi:MAG: LytTR family DNA-binding domain-containing protein [Oscillospiraceae bacterium]|nr:LytTR family DNA-binding domain-containing protein [Oscillospiraceae bacterium]